MLLERGGGGGGGVFFVFSTRARADPDTGGKRKEEKDNFVREKKSGDGNFPKWKEKRRTRFFFLGGRSGEKKGLSAGSQAPRKKKRRPSLNPKLVEAEEEGEGGERVHKEKPWGKRREVFITSRL